VRPLANTQGWDEVNQFDSHSESAYVSRSIGEGRAACRGWITTEVATVEITDLRTSEGRKVDASASKAGASLKRMYEQRPHTLNGTSLN